MPLVAEKVASASLRRQIADRVRQAILDGTLQPGERLVERDVAARFGTSLTAVREAVVQLETEGFISKRPNAFTQVTQMQRQDVARIFAVRRALEGLAFGEAASRVTPEGIRQLKDLHDQAIAAAERDDSQEYIRRDLAWHEAVWQISGNEILVAHLRRLLLPLFGFSAIRVAAQKGFDLMKDAGSHKSLLVAIESGKPHRARRAFEAAVRIWASDADDYALGSASKSAAHEQEIAGIGSRSVVRS
jgi:DNA-binding GntR family transcriptional regulator